MNWYLEVMKKYIDFTGRARRKEYWYFTLFNIIISFVLMFMDILLGLTTRDGWGPLGAIYTLAVLIPGLAVTARRLHDTSRSGWWMLLGLAPCIGLILLVYLVEDSYPGENEYGPNPKSDAPWPPGPPPPPDFSQMPR
jgi:uncharacterized membrane protein YhaH (DUF805 family)